MYNCLCLAEWQDGRARPLQQPQEPPRPSRSQTEESEIQAAGNDPVRRGLVRDAQLARIQPHPDVDGLLAKVSPGGYAIPEQPLRWVAPGLVASGYWWLLSMPASISVSKCHDRLEAPFQGPPCTLSPGQGADYVS